MSGEAGAPGIELEAIELVVFDVGGVLTRSRSYLEDWAVDSVVGELQGTAFRDALGFSLPFAGDELRVRVESTLRRCRSLYDLHPGERQPDVVGPVAELLREAGAGCDPSRLARLALPFFGRVELSPLRASACRLIERVAAGGRKWAIAANAVFPADRWRHRLARRFAASPPSCMVWSSEVGWRKPHPEPIRRATEASGCDPDRAVYVGNKAATDLAGALRAGLRGVLVESSGEGQEAPEPPAREGAPERLSMRRLERFFRR